MVTLALIESIAIQAHLSARRSLRDREARLRELANSIPGVIFRLQISPDGQSEVRFVSEHAQSLLALSAESQALLERFLEKISPAARYRLKGAIQEAVEQETPWRSEVPFRKQSGELVWLLVMSTPERRAEKLMFNGVILDIAERKEAEQAVHERQEQIESLYAATSLLLTASSPEAVVGRTYGVLHDAFDYPLGNIGLWEHGTIVPKTGDAVREEAGSILWPMVGEGDSIAERACGPGETVVVENTEVFSEDDAYDLQSFAAVPIGEHGAIVVGQEAEKNFDPFDLRLMEVLASQVTVVLDRLERG